MEWIIHRRSTNEFARHASFQDAESVDEDVVEFTLDDGVMRHDGWRDMCPIQASFGAMLEESAIKIFAKMLWDVQDQLE